MRPSEPNPSFPWMSQALSLAREASKAGEVPVGAVIVKDGAVIASAFNEVEKLNDATAHAEVLAIKRASDALGKWRLDDCSIVVTLEPCPMCIGAILLSRCKHLYFGAYDKVFGAVGSCFDLSAHSGLPRQIAVTPEVMKAECEQVLSEFFSSLRGVP